MTCLENSLVGQRLKSFDRAKAYTGFYSDLSLSFKSRTLVLCDPFTVPFFNREPTDGVDYANLRRFANWQKPPEEWKDVFVGQKLVKLDQSHPLYIYLEFSGGFTLLSNKNLVALFHKKKCLWSTMES